MDGHAHPGFARVADTFRHQLRRTAGGAAAAVYHRGDLVVDLWGGCRDDSGEPWEQDTLAMCFSTTKGVASTALHVLADRGEVDYDAPVAVYWPEFAQNAKGAVTVRHVLTHSAGLHRIRSVIDHAERMLDWEYMVEALARAAPAYQPGTASGYHALTYGWLVGEIVRRVSGRPLPEFVAGEIAGPLGLDGLYVGCPPPERHRVAPLVPMGRPRLLPGPLHGVEKAVGRQVGRLMSLVRAPVNPRRIVNTLAPRGIEDVLWDASVMDAAIPAANGFLTARSLARMYAVLAGRGTLDGVRLLSPGTVEKISEVQTTERDRVLVARMRWRLGYHGAFTTRGLNRSGFGHFGFGGSGGWADPERDLAVAMVCNRGTGTPIGDLRLLELGTAAIVSARGRSGDGGGDDDVRLAS